MQAHKHRGTSRHTPVTHTWGRKKREMNWHLLIAHNGSSTYQTLVHDISLESKCAHSFIYLFLYYWKEMVDKTVKDMTTWHNPDLFIHSFMYSFNNYRAYYVPSTVLGTENAVVHKTWKVLPLGSCVLSSKQASFILPFLMTMQWLFIPLSHTLQGPHFWIPGLDLYEIEVGDRMREWEGPWHKNREPPLKCK